MTNTAKVGNLRHFGRLSEAEVGFLGDMEPMACLRMLVPFGTELFFHSQYFIASRRARVKKISGMMLKQQNAYYRSLGYFLARSQ